MLLNIAPLEERFLLNASKLVKLFGVRTVKDSFLHVCVYQGASIRKDVAFASCDRMLPRRNFPRYWAL